MNNSPDDFDVAIIGGGLVGASLACALAPLGLNIALLEAVPFRAGVQPSYDDRTLALSASSCQILKGLGIWPDIRDNATPIREILVTELDRPGRVALKPEELGLDRFGHVVEARVFGAAVMGIIPKTSGFCAPQPSIHWSSKKAWPGFLTKAKGGTGSFQPASSSARTVLIPLSGKPWESPSKSMTTSRWP
jgi:hypothetical protein